MAWTDDIWTTWWNLGEPPEGVRNIRHIGDFVDHTFSRDYFSWQRDWVQQGIDAAYGHNNDPADREMVIHVVHACEHLLVMMTIILYALHDLREGAGSTPPTKEEIFDLWLERAAEMSF